MPFLHPAGGRTRIATIDSFRDDSTRRLADLDRLQSEAEAARAALAQMERQFAACASELAGVYQSRSWRVALMLRALFRSRARQRLPALRAPVPADMSVPEGVALIVPAGAPDAVATCNAIAAATAADRIVLWDGVSRPEAGWAQALALCLHHDTAGMAGALLLAPDGAIAAAGAAIRPDGSLAPRGAGARPDHPDFASVTEMEALPLGAVMLPASVWRRFGGLDAGIASPTLALADLALRLRAAGLSVLCQPFARFVQAPVAAEDAWAEAFGRWRVRRRRATGGNGLAALGLRPPAPPRALLVDTLVPMPDRDSGSADIHSLLQIFLALGYHVTLLPVGDLARADGYVDELRGRGVRVLAGGFYPTSADALAGQPEPYDVAMLFRGSVAGGAFIDQLRAHSPAARLLLYAGDLHFLRLEREAELNRSPALLAEAWRSEQIELAAIARADRTLLLSNVEQNLIADLLPRARTSLIPIARAIPGRSAPFAARHGVVFVGGFRHRPNVDAMLFFVREVWPLVRARLATTLTIVGADAPAEISAFASDAAGIDVRGYVPDLDGLLATCRLTVAPMRFGAGIKGKIVSSLASGVPCVATPVAVEGMGLTDGLEVRVGATPAAFAGAVVDLHEREAEWLALSDAGLAFARTRYSMDAVRCRLADILRDLGLPAGGIVP